MQRDIDTIGKVGVPKRIGSLVLDELDERAGEKISELKPNELNDSDATNNDRNNDLSRHFQLVHESQFSKMESLESHYINNLLSQTPKRHVENTVDDDEFSNSKKLKVPVQSPPPVNDITKRIRRLRLRNSLTGGNSNQSRTPTQAALKNTPLTNQRLMDPPRFLRPTINSLNKNVDPQSILKKKESRGNLRNGNTKLVPKNQTRSQQQQQQQQQQEKEQQRDKNQISRSQSVFERLYSQTTISRSCSMGNVSVRPHTHGLSGNRSHERQSNNADTTIGRPRLNSNSNGSKIIRSKTSGSLSTQLDRPAWK